MSLQDPQPNQPKDQDKENNAFSINRILKATGKRTEEELIDQVFKSGYKVVKEVNQINPEESAFTNGEAL